MQTGFRRRFGAVFSRAFPEKRVFLRSEAGTRVIRLSPLAQAATLTGGAVVTGWSIVAASVMLISWAGTSHPGATGDGEQALYESRLNQMSAERDQALSEADVAQDRFSAALARVSEMQSDLLATEARVEELQRGMDVAQERLRTALVDHATLQAAEVEATPRRDAEAETTVEALAAALSATAGQRDALASDAANAETRAEELLLEARLEADRTERIFQRLEEAMAVSVEPLDEMFGAAGLDADELIETVREGYAGQGGPLTPISLSTMGEGLDPDSQRANRLLEQLDEMNLYRIAAQKAPFALPLKDSFRFTSGFGRRWGRMHEGTDFAGAHGLPIYATADGVITHAGRLGGYGNLVKIRHDFGIETRYAHMSQVRVAVGQRISRGERIGDMGNTGRSTGTHLHYEIRVDGTAVNPMTYIKAAQDVF